MTRPSFARPPAPRAIALALSTLALPALVLAPLDAPALAAGAKRTVASKQAPRVATGSVTHVRGTSAVLQGSVNPRGLETSYYFQYGPTIAYGSQTATVNVGKGTTNVKVSQTVASFAPGSHYRIVASNEKGQAIGRDRIYTAGKGRLKFAMADTKELPPTPYGGTFVLRGTLSGLGGALHAITPQASPYPFLTAFADLGFPFTTSVPGVVTPLSTNAAGAFAIPIKGLKQSTQLRVRTNDARPLLSPIVTASVSVKVTLQVRASSHKGLVRLYGTVTPAKVGARVLFQLEKAVRPHGKSEKETHFATQESSVVKRGTRTVSRFSQVMTVRRGGRYRAYVVLRSGPLVSGASPSVTLHAAPGSGKRKGK